MILFKLFLEFFKTGLFSIGGGLATLPFLFKMAENHGWFSAEELSAMIAVAESTPGPIGVNVATYAGFKTFSVTGGITATLSLVLPSLITILIIAGFLEKFRSNKMVENVFFGLRPAVVGLISVSVMTLFKTTFVNELATIWYQFIDIKKALLFVLTVFLVFKLKKHPILYIALGAVAGIVFSL